MFVFMYVAIILTDKFQIEFLLKLTNIQCFQYLIQRFNSPKGQRKVWKGWKWFRTQMITLSFCRGRDDKIQVSRTCFGMIIALTFIQEN